jgi:hypothetical protein
VLYHPASIGQRAATNEAARIARAPYVMKLDAHCSVAPGFDEKLLEAAVELGRDVLQVPAQKNLHVFDWICTREGCGWREYQGPVKSTCPDCGSPTTRDVLWKPRRGTTTTAWRFDADLHFQYDKRRQEKQQGTYPETLSLLGACWFVERAWFLETLEGLDERHGSWGQMGTELACKAWLSGGRVVCNKNTWYAHLFRTRADFSFPYQISGQAQEAARAHSRSLWKNNLWRRQERPLRELVEQFWPVDGWSETDRDGLPPHLPPSVVEPVPTEDADTSPTLREDELRFTPVFVKRDSEFSRVCLEGRVGETRSAGVLYYSDCRGPEVILDAVRRQLRYAAAGLPIVAVTLDAVPPWGADASVVLPLERGYVAMTRQILAGLRVLDTDVVFFCEHDCLYPEGYFGWRPPSAEVYGYAGHTWKVDAATGRALHYKCEQLSGLCADRLLLLGHYQRRLSHLLEQGFTRSLGFEPGKPRRHGGLDDVPRHVWWNETPIVDIRHGYNLTPSRWLKTQFRNQRYTDGWTEAGGVPGWGPTANRFDAWLMEVTTHGGTRGHQ